MLVRCSGSSYLWSNGAITPSINVTTSGSYTVTVTGANGCSATSAATVVTVNALPTATITPSGATTFCRSGGRRLGTGSGWWWLWSNGDITHATHLTPARR